MMNNKKRAKELRQKRINDNFTSLIIINMFIIFIIALIFNTIGVSENNKTEDEVIVVYESRIDHNINISSANAQ